MNQEEKIKELEYELFLLKHAFLNYMIVWPRMALQSKRLVS